MLPYPTLGFLHLWCLFLLLVGLRLNSLGAHEPRRSLRQSGLWRWQSSKRRWIMLQTSWSVWLTTPRLWGLQSACLSLVGIVLGLSQRDWANDFGSVTEERAECQRELEQEKTCLCLSWTFKVCHTICWPKQTGNPEQNKQETQSNELRPRYSQGPLVVPN